MRAPWLRFLTLLSVLSIVHFWHFQNASAQVVDITPVGQDIPMSRDVDSLHFSRDGKSLVVMTSGICWLCDVANPSIRAPGIQGPHMTTGEDRPPAVTPVIGDTSYSTGVAHFSLDSKSLLVRTHRTIQKWDAMRGNSLNRPVRIGGDFGVGDMNPVTGDLFLVSWSISYANPLRPQPAPVVGMAFNPISGKRVGKPIPFDQIPWPGNRDHWEIEQVTYSPDGKLLAVVHANAMARLFDVQKGKELVATGLRPAQQFGDSHSHVVWSPDSKRLFIHTQNGGQLWDPVALTPVGEFIKTVGNAGGNSARLRTRASFSPDSSTLAVPVYSNSGHAVQLVGSTAGELGRSFSAVGKRGGDIEHLQYIGNSLLVISDGSGDLTPWLWNPATGEPIAQPTKKVGVGLAAVSPTGKNLATFHGYDGQKYVRIWKLP